MQITGDTSWPRRSPRATSPISQLADARHALSQFSGVRPIYALTAYSVGSRLEPGETALLANVAKATYGLDGTGVKVGVLSTSVNEYDNPAVPGIGLAESYSTGDLSASNPVTVLKDFDTPTDPTFATDEGRAMLEQIHDIAPASSLLFYSGINGEVDFANGIHAPWPRAGAKYVIVDDLGCSSDEPFFQDGVIQQAINEVTNTLGVTYFSAAGNSADAGYASNFPRRARQP